MRERGHDFVLFFLFLLLRASEEWKENDCKGKSMNHGVRSWRASWKFNSIQFYSNLVLFLNYIFSILLFRTRPRLAISKWKKTLAGVTAGEWERGERPRRTLFSYSNHAKFKLFKLSFVNRADLSMLRQLSRALRYVFTSKSRDKVVIGRHEALRAATTKCTKPRETRKKRGKGRGDPFTAS